MPLATVRGTDSSLPTARQNSPAPEAPQPRAQHPGVRPSWRGHPRKRKISSRLLLLASYASARDARQSRNSACSTRLLAPLVCVERGVQRPVRMAEPSCRVDVLEKRAEPVPFRQQRVQVSLVPAGSLESTTYATIIFTFLTVLVQLPRLAHRLPSPV